MKRFLDSVLLLLISVLTLSSCQKDMEYGDSGVIPVGQLVSPATGAELWLVNDPEANMMFEWAKPQELTAQSYYVVFYDKPAGGRELLRFDNRSTKCQAVIPHDDLVTMAVQAGIKSEQSGDIYWSVISYHGNSETVATAARNKLTVTRYAAFDDYPVNLYLGGVADTEEENQLRAFYNNGKGVFEMYAEVKAGEEYCFTNRGDGGSVDRRFISSAGPRATGTLLETTDAAQPLDGYYHFTVDFYRARVKIQEIQDVVYFYCGDGSKKPMAYKGKGMWEVENYTIPSGDDRYRFQATVDGEEYIWGAPKSLDSAPTDLSGPYFDITMTPKGSADQWSYKYKFMSVVKGQTVKFRLNMFGSRNYHEIDMGNVTPVPVLTFTTPAELSSSTPSSPVDLADVYSVDLKFSWTVPGGTYGIAPKYKVVFYQLKAGQYTAVKSVDAGTSLEFNVDAGTLDNVLSEMGVKAGEVGTIYWGVDTYILNKTAAQTGDLKPMSLKRLKLPDNLYITGAASEYGTTLSNAGKMTVVGNAGSGVFQLYTKLTAGSYNFVTGTSGAYKTYTMTDGKLVEGTGAIAATAGIYLITANVGAKTLTLAPVTNVRLMFDGRDNSGTFNYSAKGCWVLSPGPSNKGWEQERYRFQADVAGVTEVWGYCRNNNDPAVSPFDAVDKENNNNPPTWIYVRPNGSFDAWAYTYKAKTPGGRNGDYAHDMQKISLYMNGDATDSHPHFDMTIKWLKYGSLDAPASTHYLTVTK